MYHYLNWPRPLIHYSIQMKSEHSASGRSTTRGKKRSVYIELNSGFDAMSVQHMLDGFVYELPYGVSCVLKAKICKEETRFPAVHNMPTATMHSSAIIPYISKEDLEVKSFQLDAQLLLLNKQKAIIKAERELVRESRKLHKEYTRKVDDDSDSEDDEGIRRKYSKRSLTPQSRRYTRKKSSSPSRRSKSQRSRSRSVYRSVAAGRRSNSKSSSQENTRSKYRHRRDRSPQRASRSRKRWTKSPNYSMRSPKRHIRTPSRISSSPKQHIRTPSRISSSPMQHIRTPSRISRSPKRHIRTPSRISRSQKRHIRTPSRISRLSKRHIISPPRISRSFKRQIRSPPQSLKSKAVETIPFTLRSSSQLSDLCSTSDNKEDKNKDGDVPKIQNISSKFEKSSLDFEFIMKNKRVFEKATKLLIADIEAIIRRETTSDVSESIKTMVDIIQSRLKKIDLPISDTGVSEELILKYRTKHSKAEDLAMLRNLQRELESIMCVEVPDKEESNINYIDTCKIDQISDNKIWDVVTEVLHDVQMETLHEQSDPQKHKTELGIPDENSNKQVPKNPMFLTPVRTLLRQMKSLMITFEKDCKYLYRVTTLVLKNKLTIIMKNKEYTRNAEIIQLYRSQNPKKKDKQFVKAIVEDIKNGKYIKECKRFEQQDKMKEEKSDRTTQVKAELLPNVKQIPPLVRQLMEKRAYEKEVIIVLAVAEPSPKLIME